MASFAQQIPQYSQYMLNDYILNPAMTGQHDYWEVKSNNRLNWIGITDAPRTFILSAHGPFRKHNMGMGGSVFADITGPTSRVGFYLSYAYHLKLSKSLKNIQLRQKQLMALQNLLQNIILDYILNYMG